MNVSSFYSNRRVVRERITTLRESLDVIETSAHPTSIVVLPPAAGLLFVLLYLFILFHFLLFFEKCDKFYLPAPNLYQCILDFSNSKLQSWVGSQSVCCLCVSLGDSAVDSDVEEVSENLRNEEPFETAGEMEIEVELSDDDDDDAECDESEVESLPPKRMKDIRGKAKDKCNSPVWAEKAAFSKVLSPDSPAKLADQFPMLTTSSPYFIWSLIFDSNMIDDIVNQTMLYASTDKNDQQFVVTREEICQFIGILILSGYHSLPRESDYWSSQQDLGVPVVSEAMSSKRYQTIKRYIHLADNRNLKPGDKTAKIAPIVTALNDNLVQFGFFHRDLSIDESMTPYFGRHSMKMFIKAKPIRFGFKWWCLCGTDGYPYHLKLYAGREEASYQEPLGTRVVNNMVDVVQKHSNVKMHHLFFDNFFTSHALMVSLADRDFAATGTIRENRTGGANKEFQSSKEIKKKCNRGDFEHRCDGTVYVVKWYDNSIVCAASNKFTHEPVQTTSRRVKGQSNIAVKQPYIIRRYNEGMGGVDLMDRLLASYRPVIRGKKWWWPLFSNIINVSVVAAWRIHCALHGNEIDHLSFRRDIALCLLKGKTPPPRSNQVANPPDDVRLESVLKHERIDTTQGRCRVCMKNTRVMCSVCKVRLHTDKGKSCFTDYHSK